jgi:nitrate reductase gamma subunit
MNTLLWVVFPYICLAVFVVGHWWRWKYDKFGWTTRSSQLYEDNLLRWGSPLFHFGMLGVVGGHIIGLLLPKGWTDRIGVSEHTYHSFALGGGLIAGAMAFVGMVMLIYRRRMVRPVFKATTPMDKVMYLFLGAVIALGCWNTVASVLFKSEFNYRTTVSPWFRQIFWFQPDAALMANVPLGFKVHALLAFALFALWPFTRLVHVFSAPLGYLTRPYIVYRSRDERVGYGVGSRAPQRGWERPTLDDARK